MGSGDRDCQCGGEAPSTSRVNCEICRKLLPLQYQFSCLSSWTVKVCFFKICSLKKKAQLLKCITYTAIKPDKSRTVHSAVSYNSLKHKAMDVYAKKRVLNEILPIKLHSKGTDRKLDKIITFHGIVHPSGKETCEACCGTPTLYPSTTLELFCFSNR